MMDGSLPDLSRWDAGHNRRRRGVRYDQGTGTNDGATTDPNSRPDEHSRSNPALGSKVIGDVISGNDGVEMIVRRCAQVGFLGDHAVFSNGNLRDTVKCNIIPNPAIIADLNVPRKSHMNPRSD